MYRQLPKLRVAAVVLGLSALSAAALANIMTQNRGDGTRGASDMAHLLAALDGGRPGAGAPAATPIAAQSPQTVRDIERELGARGYVTGTGDGTVTLVTRAAILAYEHDTGLVLTAEPSVALLKAILLGRDPSAAAAGAGPSRAGSKASAEADQLVRTAQSALARLGHLKSRPTGLVQGRLDPPTVLAIKAFELSERLAPTGRVSGELMQRLERRAALGQLSR